MSAVRSPGLRPRRVLVFGALFTVAAVLVGLASCGTDPAKELKELAGFDDRAVVLAEQPEIDQGDVVEDSYIVAFRNAPGASPRTFASFAAEVSHHYSRLAAQFLGDPRVLGINYVTTTDLGDPRDPTRTEELSPPPALRLALSEARGPIDTSLAEVRFAAGKAGEVLAEWDASGSLWFAEPNRVNRLMDGNPVTKAVVDAYTAADAKNFWWHKSINLPAALATLAGKDIPAGSAPVVAVLDSGLDVEHPAFKDRVWVNDHPGQSGCSNDVNGCDTTRGKKDLLGAGESVFPFLTTGFNTACSADAGGAASTEGSTCEHGTHVAGIIASALTNEVGGVCPVCRIMPIKIITNIKGKGAAPDTAILNGFKYLTLFKNKNANIVRVANSSFGKYTRSRSVALLISVLTKAPNEVLVVGAASNEDSMARAYPAAYNDAIAVAALRSTDGKATYSNFGPWVDVAAPGGGSASGGGGTCDISICSTLPGGGTGPKQGTSMASPVVAGVAGLVVALEPGISFSSLRARIIQTADPRLYNPEVDGGINRTYYYPKATGDTSRRPLLGSGVVDANAAVIGTAQTGFTPPELDRVNAGCGVVTAAARTPSDAALGLALLVSLGLALLPRRIRR